jgi:4-amino-4-deoxy-L-arabinose transferase-like glycosyltransferase
LHAHNILRDIVILCALAALALWAAWIGYQGYGWDDAHYLLAGEQWAAAAPYVGQTHWEARLGFVLPLALSIKIFGFNEFAIVLVPIIFYSAMVATTYVFASLLLGRPYGFFAALATAMVPLIAAWGTTPRVAVAEGFYLLLSFWCFAAATVTRKGVAAWLLAAGLVFGFAWLTRESALGFVFALLLPFALGTPISRRRYLWFALGAMLVVVAEMGFYWTQTGNPFYRLYIDLNHGTITAAGGHGDAAREVVARARGAGLAAEALGPDGNAPGADVGGQNTSDASADTDTDTDADSPPAPGATERGVWLSFQMILRKLGTHFDLDRIPKQGTVSPVPVSGLAEPYLLLLIEPYYGLVFPLGALGLLYLLATRQPPRVKHLSLFAILFASSVVVAGLYLLYLRPLPRYFVFPSAMAATLFGFALASLWLRGRRRAVVLFLGVFVATSLVFMEARRGLGLHNERRLVEFATQMSAPIVSDKGTISMAAFFVQAGEFRGAVSGCPLPGSVYFFNGERTVPDQALDTVALSLMLGTGEKVFEYRAREKLLGMILRLAGGGQHVPAYVLRRLAFPYGAAAAFSVGWVELCGADQGDNQFAPRD